MIVTRKHINRRTFLRGAGVAVALPLLDSMVPAFANPRLNGKAPLRMGFVYVPNGIVMPDWTPASEGKHFDLPRILKPVEAHREQFTLLSGLTHNGGRALGDGPGDHARAAASFLTGAHPKKTFGADINAGISVDQVAAAKIGSETRFASLELGCEDGRQVGNCDSGYSCAYSNSISWRTPSTPNPPEINPRSVFERLFSGIDTTLTPEQRAKRDRYSKSILDFVLEDTRRLKGTLGPTDQRKLDEYLHAVREIERRIASAESKAKDFTPSFEKPEGIPVDFAEHSRLMFDLMLVAFQSGLTRISTLMLGREGSSRSYREIGVSDSHHPLTHHRGDAEMIEKVTKINVYHMEQFSYFLEKMKTTPDGDGSLLDHSMILYGSGLSDGNRHHHHDLPALLAGAGNGSLHPGRHVRCSAETPMSNLFLSLLDRVGVPAETIGDANGKLDTLSEV